MAICSPFPRSNAQSVVIVESETKEFRSLNYLVQTDTGILPLLNKGEGHSRTPTEEREVILRTNSKRHGDYGMSHSHINP